MMSQDCEPPDFFEGIDSGYLLESFAKKHMNYIVSNSTVCEGRARNLIMCYRTLQCSVSAICVVNTMQ